MKLYVGARDYKPEGYLTVDVDSTHGPDIVADITKMSGVDDASCSEIVASHVLEHLEWPDSFAAMAEFSRVLRIGGVVKIAIPDADLLAGMLKTGSNPFYVVGLLFGVGGRSNSFEQHRYSFNADMMGQILSVLGFKIGGWWNSSMPDASNGWCVSSSGNRVAISLNLQAEKISTPLVDVAKLYEKLVADPLSDFAAHAKNFMIEPAAEDRVPAQLDASIYQLIHYQLIETRQRVRYLERKLEDARSWRAWLPWRR